MSGPLAGRSFRPARLARLEADEWMAYYARSWIRVLIAALGLVREGFGLSWPRTVWGAWLVLRANRCWAPYPNNDADGARRHMARFYALVAWPSADFDPTEAARLDVAWWRAHRELQHHEGGLEDLVAALAALYSYTYRVDLGLVRQSARLRAEAMEVCDRWVEGGRSGASPLIGEMRKRLLASYLNLRAAVA